VKMASIAGRSGIRGRPPFGLGLSGGNSGAISVYNASEVVHEPLATAPPMFGLPFREPFSAQSWPFLIPYPGSCSRAFSDRLLATVIARKAIRNGTRSGGGFASSRGRSRTCERVRGGSGGGAQLRRARGRVAGRPEEPGQRPGPQRADPQPGAGEDPGGHPLQGQAGGHRGGDGMVAGDEPPVPAVRCRRAAHRGPPAVPSRQGAAAQVRQPWVASQTPGDQAPPAAGAWCVCQRCGSNGDRDYVAALHIGAEWFAAQQARRMEAGHGKRGRALAETAAAHRQGVSSTGASVAKLAEMPTHEPFTSQNTGIPIGSRLQHSRAGSRKPLRTTKRWSYRARSLCGGRGRHVRVTPKLRPAWLPAAQHGLHSIMLVRPRTASPHHALPRR